MTFDQIVAAMESVANQQPQNLRSLLYILIASDKAGSIIASVRAPMRADLLSLVDGSPVAAELVAEFDEIQRVAQARAMKPQYPIVE